jgi:hypothetical protein
MSEENKEQKKIVRPASRTLAQDMAEAVKMGGGSMKSLLEEEKAKEMEQRQKRKTSLLAMISFLLIFLAIGIIVYFSTKKPEVAVVPIGTQSIIYSEKSSALDVTGQSKDKLIKNLGSILSQKDLGKNEVKAIHLIEGTAGGKTIIQTRRFFEIFRISLSPSFLNILSTRFLFGVYGADKDEPFLLILPRSFNEAFEGMRVWETKMLDDLYPILSIEVGGENQYLFQAKFEDTNIQNVSGRAMKNKDGQVVLYYAFLLNDKAILIAKDPGILPEILRRLQRPGVSL